MSLQNFISISVVKSWQSTLGKAVKFIIFKKYHLKFMPFLKMAKSNSEQAAATPRFYYANSCNDG